MTTPVNQRGLRICDYSLPSTFICKYQIMYKFLRGLLMKRIFKTVLLNFLLFPMSFLERVLIISLIVYAHLVI